MTQETPQTKGLGNNNRPEREWEFPRWLEGAAGVLAVAGIPLYTTLAVSYYAFYGTLGVSPSDVGLDYITTFTSSIGALIFLAAGILYMVAGATLPYIAFSKLVRRRRNMQKSAQYTLVVIVIIVGYLFVTWLLATLARDQAQAVQEGISVSDLDIAGIPILSIEANQATVSWVSGAEPGSDSTIFSHNLLYLGSSGGTTVLYDVTDRTVLRLPVSSIAIAINP